MRALLALFGALVLACGTGPLQSQPMATVAASPTSAASGWPSVSSLRAALATAGYQLFKDTTDDGQTRWTGEDPRTAPIEILGGDKDPAKLAVVIARDASRSADLDAVLAFFSDADRKVVAELVTTARNGADHADAFEAVDLSKPISLGLARVFWAPPDSGAKDEMTVFLEPDARAFP
jgi:hypothetical protein